MREIIIMGVIEHGLTEPSNIDRLFAIWQALNEDDKNADRWVTKQKSVFGNFSTKQNGDEDANTPLYPFRAAKDDWFTSENTVGPKSIKRTEKFGYTYPEIAGLSYPVPQKSKDNLFDNITKKYTNASRLIRKSRAGDPHAGDHLLPQAQILKDI